MFCDTKLSIYINCLRTAADKRTLCPSALVTARGGRPSPLVSLHRASHEGKDECSDRKQNGLKQAANSRI